MPAKSSPSDHPQQVSISCHCGKKTVATQTRSRQRLRCPTCGQIVVIPPMQVEVDETPTSAVEETQTTTGNRGFMIAFWSLSVVGIIAVLVGAGAFIHFDGKRRLQARIDAANREVSEAAKAADGWLMQVNAKEAENVEQRLIKAIATKDVSEKANAEAVLEAVRTRRAELAADLVFDSAKTKLNEKAIVDAVELLHQYLDDPHAVKKPEAEQLLEEIELANSDNAALKTLIAMSEEQYVQFSNTGKLDEPEVTHPVLVELRTTTLRRNLDAVNQRRDEIKMAQAERQKEQDQIAEAKRHDDERLAMNAAETMKPRLLGLWRWGEDSDFSITFEKDGTFVGRGPLGGRGQGLWGVDKDGSIQLSDADKSELGVVKLIAKEDKNEDTISIGVKNGDEVAEVVASRFKWFGMNEAETETYIEKQIEDLAPARPGFARSRIMLRRKIADELKTLGPAAITAVPALIEIAMVDQDNLVKRKTMKALGEIGGPQGIYAVGMAILKTQDPAVFTAAEDALMMLLPAIRSGPRTDKAVIGFALVPQDPEARAAYLKKKAKNAPFSSTRMTMDEAIFLFTVYNTGSERVAPYIEAAWKDQGYSKASVAGEIKRRADEKAYKEWAAAAAEQAARQQRKLEEAQENAAKIARLKEPSPFSGPSVPWKYTPDPKPPYNGPRQSYDPMKGGTPQRPNP